MDWKKLAVKSTDSIHDVINMIDKGGAQIALVVDDQDKLLGTVTDGDIRRGILNGVKITESVKRVFNANPITVSSRMSRVSIAKLMRKKYIRQIPVIDNEGKIIRIELLKEVLNQPSYNNWVVIMAGGLGTRLKPLTNACPKPLLKIGDKPILELLLENLYDYGFNSIYISINYKGQMISDYFGDGSRYGLDVKYLEEDKRLGTAGALTLLPKYPKDPILVMNGDLLTKVNFKQMMDFHQKSKCLATMGVIEFDYQVPYGVVTIKDEIIAEIDEKPSYKFFVNAGIYILHPRLLKGLPINQYYDMPQLFHKHIKKGVKIAAFPIRESWLDIGKPDDLERASHVMSDSDSF